METVDGLRPSEQRELLRASCRAALAFERTENVDHLVNFAKNLLATVHLRSIPAYAEALKNAPAALRGPGADVEEVLKRLME